MLNRKALRHEITIMLDEVEMDFGGGCSVTKAHVMAWLIKYASIKNSLDIGVYRGRSFFPQALAHKKYTNGVVYGVDPYTKEDAKEQDNNALRPQIDEFVANTDFNELFDEVTSFQKAHKLIDNSKIVRLTSNKAAEEFKSKGTTFGLIHIDGNHDAKEVLEDVENYMPLLIDGGFMVLDDISWQSVKPATGLVNANLTLLYARVDIHNDYAVFYKGTSRPKVAYLRAALGYIGEDKV